MADQVERDPRKVEEPGKNLDRFIFDLVNDVEWQDGFVPEVVPEKPQPKT